MSQKKKKPKNNIKSNHIDWGNWYDCTCPSIPDHLSQKYKGFVNSCYFVLSAESLNEESVYMFIIDR